MYWDMKKYTKAWQSWAELAVSTQMMAISAAEVIATRSAQMAIGSMSHKEAVGMVMEKPVAFAKAAERAAFAAMRGAPPEKVMSAALKPVASKARSNARRLRG